MTPTATMMRLGYLGLLPFYGLVAGAMIFTGTPAQRCAELFAVYSLAILSFLAGTLWGRAQISTHGGIRTLVVSNVLVVVAVLALIPDQLVAAILVLSLEFAWLLWFEWRGEELPAWYRRLRGQLTAAVLLAHGLMLWALLQA
jgi:hypothetical protein